jgi:hypothetical protein
MIPSIFVSSTIRDLQHLRDAIRDVITDLEYVAVMSEYGDIGYLPNLSAPDSCYAAAKDCQLAVLIVGKRYGDPAGGGLSVTHKEFQTIKEAKIPLVTLIEKETWTFKRVYDANTGARTGTFPGMDHPEKTFALIQEIIDSPTNNGILPFEHVSDARTNFKKQLAHIFGNYLRGVTSLVKADVKDILSEIIALRQEMQKGQPRQDDTNLRIIRFLVEDRAKDYRRILEHMFGSLEVAVGVIGKQSSFLEVLRSAGYTHETVKGRITHKEYADSNDLLMATESMDFEFSGPKEDGGISSWLLLRSKKIILNQTALNKFESLQNTVSVIAKQKE